MDWKAHGYRVGTSQEWFEDGDLPVEADALDAFSKKMRKRIEPWLSAVFQSEHLNLLVGSGFTIAVGHIAGASSTEAYRERRRPNLLNQATAAWA